MIKYSVIIPVYNSQNTLARCLDSLLCQGRDDLQIIAVNDGSSDRSEEILRDYAARYAAVEFVSQENAGVSQARNTGLHHAKGRYISFLDSDDYVAQDYFDVLDTADDSDLAVFAHENAGGPAVDESALFEALIGADSPDKCLELLLSSRKIMSPCNKRFKRSLIQNGNIQFIKGLSVGEDFNFCTAYAMQSQTIFVIAKPIIYFDISDQSSLSRRYRPDLDEQLVRTFHHVECTIRDSEVYRDKVSSLLSIADYLFVKHVFSCIAEEFKAKPLHYFRDRKRIISICQSFETRISDGYCNMIHFALRLLLKCRIYWPFYMVTYWAKGRKYRSR